MTTPHITDTSLQTFRSGMATYVIFEDTEWEILKKFIEFKVLKKKDHFAVSGKICDHIGFVVNGSVRYYHIKDGTEITGYFSFENDFVSSYKSYVTRTPGTGYIQVLQETELVIISYHNMEQMLNHPLLAYKMERFGRLVAEHYICCYEDRIASFILESPEERYLKMLETDPDIMQRVPQHYVANYLGVTPVSLSRIRKRTVFQPSSINS